MEEIKRTILLSVKVWLEELIVSALRNFQKIQIVVLLYRFNYIEFADSKAII